MYLRFFDKQPLNAHSFAFHKLFFVSYLLTTPKRVAQIENCKINITVDRIQLFEFISFRNSKCDISTQNEFFLVTPRNISTY